MNLYPKPKKYECKRAPGCKNLSLMSICNGLKDSFYSIEKTLDELRLIPEDDSDSILDCLREKQEFLQTKYGLRVEGMVELAKEYNKGVVAQTALDPSSASCTDRSTNASLVAIVFAEFQLLQPNSKEELAKEMARLKEEYKLFFR